jgi:hypothetical protein
MRLKLRLRNWLAAMAGAAALGFVALPVQAAPTGGTDALRAAAGQNADVQKVHWDGRRYRHRHYYGPRYGYRHHYRPGFRSYYGPRYHRRHWHHRGW